MPENVIESDNGLVTEILINSFASCFFHIRFITGTDICFFCNWKTFNFVFKLKICMMNIPWPPQKKEIKNKPKLFLLFLFKVNQNNLYYIVYNLLNTLFQTPSWCSDKTHCKQHELPWANVSITENSIGPVYCDCCFGFLI